MDFSVSSLFFRENSTLFPFFIIIVIISAVFLFFSASSVSSPPLTYLGYRLDAAKISLEASLSRHDFEQPSIRLINQKGFQRETTEQTKLTMLEMVTHAAFTYGTLLKRCGMKTSTRRRAPAEGTRHCMLSMFEVILKFFFIHFDSIFFFLLSPAYYVL